MKFHFYPEEMGGIELIAVLNEMKVKLSCIYFSPIADIPSNITYATPRYLNGIFRYSVWFDAIKLLDACQHVSLLIEFKKRCVYLLYK